MLWKIYYSDDSTFSSGDGPVSFAPGWGVIAVVQTDEEVGREILSGGDYYIFKEHKWISIKVDGLDDHLITVGIEKHSVKKGRGIERSLFKKVYAKAIDDSDFPVKSAKLPDEKS